MTSPVSLMSIDQLNKQTCSKHQGQQVFLVNLARDTPFPALACSFCMDEQQNGLKPLYISLKNFLNIQKSYKQINYTDVEKQLCQLNYVQKSINQIFENEKLAIVKRANDRKLAEKYNINMPEPGAAEQECKKQVIQFNDKYLDIEKWIKDKNSPDQIDNKVRQKYFKQNNAIIELDKVLKESQQCFKYRIERNKSIDAQMKQNRQKQVFRLGQYSKNQKAQIALYESKYEKQHHSKYDEFQFVLDDRHWFDPTFLKRYLRQASIHAKRLDFINPMQYQNEIQELSEDVASFAWHNLQSIFFLNKFTDKDISQVFKMIKSRPITCLEFYQPRQCDLQHERQIHARNQEQLIPLPEIDIKRDITFVFFEQYQFAKLKYLTVDRILINTVQIQKCLKACPNIQGLTLIKNQLPKDFFPFFSGIMKQKKLPNLKQLIIGQNNLKIQQVTELFSDKQGWSELKQLNLSFNKIDDTCFTKISECSFNKLQLLILNNNKMKSPVELITKQWKKLKNLSLQCNEIETSFSIALSRKIWSQQIFIYLNGNRIIKKQLDKVLRYQPKINGQYDWQRKPIDNFIQDFIQEKFIVQDQNGTIQFIPSRLNIFNEQYIKKPQQVFHKIDTLFISNPFVTCNLIQKILNITPSPEEVHESEIILGELNQKIQENDLLSIVLLGLRRACSRQGVSNPVIYTRKSNIKSQICTKMISTQFLWQLVRFEQALGEQWNFEQLSQDENLLYKLKQQQLTKICEQYKLKHTDISIDKILKNQNNNLVRLQWSCNPNVQNQILSVNQTKKKLRIIPFIQQFWLSLEDFGAVVDFPEQVRVQTIGKWPWYVPVKGKMLTINANRKFDNGNNDWILAQNKEAQWPVVYQCMSSPSSMYIASNLKFGMPGLNEGQMIKGTGRQKHSQLSPLNFPDQKLGSGNFVLPYLYTALSSSSSVILDQKRFAFILICRVKNIKVCPNNTYWLINQDKDIRPYGIFVLARQNQQAVGYQTPAQMYPEQQFTWEAFKDRINQ